METIFPPDHLALTHVNEVAPTRKRRAPKLVLIFDAR
jgi:hypothetical protein